MNEIEKELLRKAVEYSYTIEMYRMMYAGRRYDNFFELPFLRKKT